MVVSHLVLLLLIGAAVAHDSCLAPGSTVTTTKTSTTTTTVSAEDDDDGIISAADRHAIRSIWAQARKNSGVIGPQILLRLLQRNPAIQQKFPRFADVAHDQLASNHDFQVQAFTIMAGFNDIIETSCSHMHLAEEVGLMGLRHKLHGASAADFKLMGEVIFEVLSDYVTLSAQAKSALQNGLRALTDGIAANLKPGKDLTEPRSGLIERQIVALKKGWNLVREQRSKIAGAILKSVLKQSPGLQQKFPRFANVPLDALDSDTEFQKQAAAIGDRIDAVVSELEGGMRLEGELIYLVVSHKARGVDTKILNTLIDAVMEQVSGGGAPAELQVTYRQVLQTLGNNIRRIEKAML